MSTEDQTQPQAIDQLRERASQATAAEQAASDAKRELAFVKAGVDTDTKLGQMMMTGYDGELTDEAIKAFSAEILPNVPEVPTEPALSDPVTPAAEPASPIGDLNSIAGSAAPETSQAVDLLEQGFREFDDAQKAGRNRNEAAAEVIQRMIDGAVREHRGEEGISGFVYDRQKFHEGAPSGR